MKRTALLACLLFLPLLARSEERIEQRITLATEDGWDLSARYLQAAPGAPTVVLVHSQKSDHTEWNPWLPALKRYGFGYLSMDLRGHGDSFVAPDGSTTSWRAFSPSGSDNEYNKMLRDVESALAYLSTNSVTGDQIVLAGDVLGANLVIKAAAIHPEISRVVAISPVLNVNGVLSVNPLRAYGRRPILMIGGAGNGRQFKEFLLLNDIARLTSGKDNASVMIESSGFGPQLITRYNASRVLDWILAPRLPEIVQYSTAAPAALPPGATGQQEAPGGGAPEGTNDGTTGADYPDY